MRILMRRREQRIRVVLERRLRAIAMVDVEIDDRDPLQAVRGAGMQCADCLLYTSDAADE